MDKDSSSNATQGMCRREFLGIMAVAGVTFAGVNLASKATSAAEAIAIKETNPGEDVFAYVTRIKGRFDQTLYQQVIGASNAFKEGDQTIGVGADDEATRQHARILLANTKIKDLYEHPLLEDDLQKLIWQSTNQAQHEKVKDWTMADLKVFLLTKSEAEIKGILRRAGTKALTG
jgi:ethanolamine ammonia-lyase large subunit